jgi:tetratricopeptide (TPR) repeat protein
MVACPKCVINNTLDSAFCKKCGAVLPISMIEEEQEKLKEIVSKGMESFQHGNLDEAMAVAEHSILTNPSYGEAYALKGLVHERKGQYAEALDSYETVVALNPDSTMDKIKLNQLRNAFATRQAGEPKMDRKGALLTASAVAIACLAIGGISYGIMTSTKETKQNLAAKNSSLSNTALLVNQANNSPSNPPPTSVDPNRQNPQPGDVGAVGQTDSAPPADTAPRTASRRTGGGNRENFGNGDVEVVTPRGPVGPAQGTLPPSQGREKPKNDPIDPAPNPQNGSDKSIDPPVKADTSTMEVSISHTGNSSNGSKGSDGTGSSSSGKAFQRQAQQNQRSGKTAQARDAYQKAIDAYQKEIDSGKGDKDAAAAGINSSKQALKNLKD